MTQTIRFTLSFFLLNIALLNAQSLIDTTIIDIPYIGQNGGAHMLNWRFNNEKDKIYLYFYSHTNGSQIISSDEEMTKARKKHNEKSYFGKLISSLSNNDVYQNTVIPIVFEKVLSVDSLKPISERKLLFHKAENLSKDKNVYFKKSSGIADLSFPFRSGKKIKYHYKDLNTPFKFAPKFNHDIIKLTSIDLRGEGLLGLKNLSPVLTTKRGFFTYEEQKGYISKVESIDILEFSKDPRLRNYSYVENSEEIIDNNYFAWFVNENNLSEYKIAVYNEDYGLKITHYDFEAPRKQIVANMRVYDKKMNLMGLLNIFGYHKKGKKNKGSYPTNRFDILYTSPNGQVKFKTKLDHGKEKKYKRIFNPILVMENDKQELELLNNHISSPFNSNYERLTINSSGEITLIYSDDYYKVKDKKRINYFNYLSQHDRIDIIEDFYVLRKIISKKINTSPANTSQNASEATPEWSDTNINYTILDKNFKPIDFKSFSVAPSLVGKIKFQTLENKNGEIVFVCKKQKQYYLIKITESKPIPQIYFYPLEVELSKTSSPILYFGDFTRKLALVSKKNRSFYILSQFYDLNTYGTKIIDKVGITKFKY